MGVPRARCGSSRLHDASLPEARVTIWRQCTSPCSTDAHLPTTPALRPAAAALVLALVLGLHAVLAWVLDAGGISARSAPPPEPARVRLRMLVPPEPPRASPSIQAVDSALAHPLARRANRPHAPTDRPATPPAGHDERGAPPSPTQAATGVDSEPGTTESTNASGRRPPGILDSAATRQAIVDAARTPSLAELPGTNRRASAQHQLGGAIAAGAHGDCDKGEFAGGGMGLLSLPFWAVAQLRGACGR